MAPPSLAARIKSQGAALGFDLVGIAPIQEPMHGAAFSDWLGHGFHGEMAYMARTAHRRLFPGQFLPWARSIVSVGLNYNAPPAGDAAAGSLRGRIARYARGDDYHDAMQAKLDRLLDSVRAEAKGHVQGRAVVDAGPVLERACGARAGIGWFGKNTNLLSATIGSFFVIGELFLSLELAPDRPVRDRCGRCRLCLDACPTAAFLGPYVLDARRCISYLTIELKGAIPRGLRPKIGAHIFGCDICQDVCPYNAKGRTTPEPVFQPRPDLLAPELIPLLSLTEDAFKARFRGSPLLRATRRGLLRNACVALGNLGRPDAVPALSAALARDPDSPVRAHAAWALGRIAGPGVRAALREAAVREKDPEVSEEIRSALGFPEATSAGRVDAEADTRSGG
jgi:epoxyqueuosine reductase